MTARKHCRLTEWILFDRIMAIHVLERPAGFAGARFVRCTGSCDHDEALFHDRHPLRRQSGALTRWHDAISARVPHTSRSRYRWQVLSVVHRG